MKGGLVKRNKYLDINNLYIVCILRNERYMKDISEVFYGIFLKGEVIIENILISSDIKRYFF